MIFGVKKQHKIIAAKALPGYAIFITDAFSKDFVGGEPLVVYYPPDHPNAGTKYNYTILENSDRGATGLEIMGLFGGESQRIVSGPEESRDVLKSYHLDFYISPFFNKEQDLHPLTNSGGYDSFLLKGSIIQGLQSGAKRFYDGPFKGFTVESQDGCIQAGNDVALNDLDGSSCDGYLKGSYYEVGYDQFRHDLYRYSGITNHVLDARFPLNNLFMSGTPFGGLPVNWLAIHDREKRPIPYRSQGLDNQGHSAVLISPKHAIISASRGYGHKYRFFSPSNGIVEVTVTKSTETAGPYTGSNRDFKNIWKVLGFNEPTESDVSLTETYNSMMAHFSDCRIVTFDNELPSDVVPVYLLDRNGSDIFRWAITVGQEGRGHLTYTCESTKEKSVWRFSPCMRCDGDDETYLPPNTFVDDFGKAFCNGDVGSVLYTYYRSSPVFLGMMSSITKENIGSLDYIQNTVMVRNSPPNYECFTYDPIEYQRAGHLMEAEYYGSWDIANSTSYALPWGSSISAQTLLDMWLKTDGDYEATIVNFQAEDTDTSSTYPYPIIIDEDGGVIEPGDNIVPTPRRYRLAPWNTARTYRED